MSEYKDGRGDYYLAEGLREARNSTLTAPNGLLPVRARGKHEIEAAGGWVVACGAWSEYGCMPTEVRDYIVSVLNAEGQSDDA